MILLLALACTPDPTDTGTKSDDADGDGFTTAIDCDDSDPTVGLAGTFYADSDGDTFGNPALAVEACTADAGFVADGTDCDDTDAASHPGAAEVCDSADNDCDGGVDEDATNAPTWYLDLDGDFYGDTAETACEAPAGYVQEGGDCDDGDATINPGATEICDGSDNDCDGTTDEDDADGAPIWFEDQDADGYGAGAGHAACVAPAGYTDNADDCDDTRATAYPGAAEHCDDLDEDCDGAADNDAVDPTTWFVDGDADGFGDTPTVACDLPAGASAVDGDCDDTLANVYPGAAEHCDDLDEDCDGAIDNDVADPTGWYADADGDGFGAGTPTYTCDGPADTVDNGDDCDDGDSSISPIAPEVCDDVDQDCDGVADDAAVDMVDWYDDADGDGWGGTTYTTACDQPAGTADAGGDCDDTDPGLTPGADEHCDGLDEDCDGVADDNAVDRTSFYYDADGDGYGDPAVSTLLCEEGGGFVDNHDDCDDTDIAVYDTCPASCGTLVTYPGDVSFNGFGAASDMASFCGTYNAISGDMTIENTDVADLVDLSCLCEVGGDITLKKNSTFVSFDGAQALEVIGGNLVVDDNDVLVDLTGLSGLEQVGGTFDLRSSNALLTGYGDLESLTQIGSLTARFSDFSGLERLTTIDHNLSVSRSTAFALDGLEALETVGGTLSIYGAGVTSLAPLSSLTSVAALSIDEASALPSLAGLDTLTTITGTLSISNGMLTSLDGLDNVTTLGGLNVSYAEELTDLTALSQVTELPLGIVLAGSTGLADFSAFANVTSLGQLAVNGCDGLVDFHGLDAVTSVDGALNVYYNDGLTSFAGLDALMSVGMGVLVTNNAALTSLDGLGALETIGGSLTVSTNGTDSFVGLDALTSIGGAVTVGGAGAPDSATGLETLTTIGGQLTIEKGDTTGLEAVTSLGGLRSLSNGADLTGLANVETVEDDVEVYYAPFSSFLPALTTVGGKLEVQLCSDAATTISVAPGLTSVGGTLAVVSCNTATSITGWTGITSIGGTVQLNNLASLVTVPDLSAITEIGGLSVYQVNGIKDFSFLSGLTAINGAVYVYNNTKLDDLTHLYGITQVRGSFYFSANPLITQAEAEALRDEIGISNITSTITISE